MAKISQHIKITKTTKKKVRKSNTVTDKNGRKRCKTCQRYIQRCPMIRIDFTRDEYEYIKDKAMLNDELSKIFEMKIKGYSNIQIAMELNMSDSTLARRLKTLRKKIMKVI